MDEHKLQEILTCPVCLEIAPATPYWTCAACHHMVCDACCNRLHPWQCPTCRDKEHAVPLHNETLERMAEAAGLVVQCPNRGCGRRLPPSALEVHARVECLVLLPPLVPAASPPPRRDDGLHISIIITQYLLFFIIVMLLVVYVKQQSDQLISGKLNQRWPHGHDPLLEQECIGYCTNTDCVSLCAGEES